MGIVNAYHLQESESKPAVTMQNAECTRRILKPYSDQDCPIATQCGISQHLGTMEN
jgi:hypothetical protein